MKRDAVRAFHEMSAYRVGTSCNEDGLAFSLPISICDQWDLKVGAGRLYFRGYLIFCWVTSTFSYLYVVTYIIGMSYRDRAPFKEKYRMALETEMSEILQRQSVKSMHELKDAELSEDLLEDASSISYQTSASGDLFALFCNCFSRMWM